MREIPALRVLCFLVLIFLMPFSPALGAGPLKRPFAFQHFTQKDGLSSEMVYAIGVQGDEIWFGTYAGGATLYDRAKKRVKAYTTKGEPMDTKDDGDSIKWKNLLPYNHVSVILPDKDRMWFGTYFYGFGGGGISYYRAKRNPPWRTFTTNHTRAKKVVSMAVDGDSVWVGSEQGLSLLDMQTGAWKAFYSVADGLSGNFVQSILVRPDSLWVGTNGGISRLQKGQCAWKNYSTKEGLFPGEIKSLVAVGQGIWAGSTDGAVMEYDAASDCWKKIEATDPLKNGGIHFITVTSEKAFICRDNGVSVYDFAAGLWESLTAADGLLSSTVFYAAQDKEAVWFGTDKGASRLVPAP